MTARQVTQVCYVSQRAHGLSDTAIVDRIVLPSLARNRAANIRGCLWFNSTTFLQVLEGDDKSVRRLLGKILHDSRHDSVEILLDRTVETGDFDRFSMRKLGPDIPTEVHCLLDRATLGMPFRVAESKSRDPSATDFLDRAIGIIAQWCSVVSAGGHR